MLKKWKKEIWKSLTAKGALSMKVCTLLVSIATFLGSSNLLAADIPSLDNLRSCKKAQLVYWMAKIHEQHRINKTNSPALVILSLGGLEVIGDKIQHQCEESFLPRNIDESSITNEREEWAEAMAIAQSQWFKENRNSIELWLKQNKPSESPSQAGQR